jgi:hypothetical protein
MMPTIQAFGNLSAVCTGVSHLRDEDRLRVFWGRVLRGTFGPKGEEGTGGRRKLHTRSFMICTLCRILLG